MTKLFTPLLLITLSLFNNVNAESSTRSFIEEKVDAITARAVCGDEPVIKIDDEFACAMCPDFIEVVIPEPLVLKKMVFGKFSSPNTKEFAVDTQGCEPHSNNFGGIVLLENNNEILQKRYYQPGFRLNECLKFESSKDRDILVCNEIFQAQGTLTGKFSAFRFGKNKATWRELQAWVYSEQSDLFIKSVSTTQKDLNNDNMLDLILMFKVKAQNKPVKNLKIEYVFDGQYFKLTEASKIVKKEIDNLYKQLN